MRQYSINISGRVKNFPLPKNKPLIPMFEAIVNSLHAIEERKREDPSFQSGKISIALLRDEQQSFIGELPTIEGFTISDNGISFNDRNMESFSESDSAYKSNIGGKGVGRFSWLKTFPNVHITSIYKENGFHLKREFDFSLSNKEIDDSLIEYAEYEDNCTTITFNR